MWRKLRLTVLGRSITIPQTKDQKKEKKRIAERKRMENIRKYPDKYALWKLKMKETYLKRKREEVSIISRSPDIPSSSQVLTQFSPHSARITRSTIRQKRTLGIDLNLTENETDISSNADVHSRIISPSPNTSISESPRTPSPQSSMASSPQRVVSPKVNKKAARETPLKKKSPWKHILRKFQYRYTKEIQLKDQKILELKRVHENYRKKIKRLEKDKRVTDVHKRQKENLSGNEKIQIVVEPCATGIKENVTVYFEEDENSRMCAGKKEFVTKGKIRKQKRYLSDSLQNLHKKYLETNPQYKISYSAFCKLRPFWVRVPNVNIRETCLCKDHENMELVVVAPRKNYLIVEKSVNEYQSLCCDPRNVHCLTKKCDSCKNKAINYKEFDNTKETHYFIWNKVKKKLISKMEKKKLRFKRLRQKLQRIPKI
ncbi:unnamed protein product [Parnassius apollo]|uniref:(apollo) hypothetical protein n=1 Tax=Parnassius apollo TaxID=110799 RepID=A0A8S3WNU7_PARAO|nr:unnamed protein product [Parnassius apollo]